MGGHALLPLWTTLQGYNEVFLSLKAWSSRVQWHRRNLCGRRMLFSAWLKFFSFYKAHKWWKANESLTLEVRVDSQKRTPRCRSNFLETQTWRGQDRTPHSNPLPRCVTRVTHDLVRLSLRSLGLILGSTWPTVLTDNRLSWLKFQFFIIRKWCY